MGKKGLVKFLVDCQKEYEKKQHMLAVEISKSIKYRLREQTESWQPLKKETKKRKTSGTKNKILIGRSRKLIKSLGGRYVGGKTLIGSNVVYARAHNEGVGFIPARPYLFIGEREEKIIDDNSRKLYDEK